MNNGGGSTQKKRYSVLTSQVGGSNRNRILLEIHTQTIVTRLVVAPTGFEAICQGLSSIWGIPFQGFVEASEYAKF